MGEYKRGNPTAGLGSIIGGILSLFFAGIIIFVMAVIIEITQFESGVAAIVFTSINLFIITALAFSSYFLAKKTTMVCMTNLWTVTALYTIIGIVHMAVKISEAAAMWYILFHLILLFVYLLIVAPIILSGIRQNAYRKENYYISEV